MNCNYGGKMDRSICLAKAISLNFPCAPCLRSVKCQLTTIVATAAVSTPIVNSKPTIGSDAGEKVLPSIAVTATIKTVTTKK